MGVFTERIVLASRPTGEPVEENFRVENAELGELAHGQVLTKVLWLSLDPYMRGIIRAEKSYAKNVELGEVMPGGTIAVVQESKYPGLSVGDLVSSFSGWQTYDIVDGSAVTKLPKELPKPSWALGVLGMPGFTAWHGLVKIGRPKSGETLVVAAASGPVGATVGQLAKRRGCRVIGVAGDNSKIEYLESLGFDVCLNHRDSDFAAKLGAATPNGVDIYFENVGGKVFEAVRPQLNDFARIPLCGLVSWYNADLTALPGPNELPSFLNDILKKKLLVQGFIIADHAEEFSGFAKEVGDLVNKGEFQYLEDVIIGLKNAPSAFSGLLKGKNHGKVVVKVSECS